MNNKPTVCALDELFSYWVLLRPGLQTPGHIQVTHIPSVRGINKEERQELWQNGDGQTVETEQNKTAHSSAGFCLRLEGSPHSLHPQKAHLGLSPLLPLRPFPHLSACDVQLLTHPCPSWLHSLVLVENLPRASLSSASSALLLSQVWVAASPSLEGQGATLLPAAWPAPVLGITDLHKGMSRLFCVSFPCVLTFHSFVQGLTNPFIG